MLNILLSKTPEQDAVAVNGYGVCNCDTQGQVAALTSVERALQTALGLVTPVWETEAVPPGAALGRILAEPVIAQSMMPPFDNSGMDGYAVRAADLSGEGPWTLPLSGRVAAGDSGLAKLPSGHCTRIFTGAPLPEGADAVIMQEETHVAKGGVSFPRRPRAGENIRFAGEDRAQGAIVLEKGAFMGPREIAAAAGATPAEICIHRRPRVALLCTGDEIVSYGTKPTAGRINDVNGPMISAAATALGADLVSVEHCRDSKASLTATLTRLSGIADLVVTTGGVSVGEEDHVAAAVVAASGQICVAGVAIKPGKPITLGKIGRAVFAGLPGNPVSAFVTWTIFVAPMLRKLSGAASALPQLRYVAVETPLDHRLGRSEYRPAQLIGRNKHGQDVVSAGPRVHSAQLGPLIAADGLVIIPGTTETIMPGQLVEFLPFPN
jgi:molybdopterin molybdotransferase